MALDSNPDALALKSAISVLQLQQRNATADIQNLQQIKERALEDPDSFAKALVYGNVKTKSDLLFAPSQDDDNDDNEDEGDTLNTNSFTTAGTQKIPAKDSHTSELKNWPALPTPQNIVRCPPINWNQYAVVGESLDKMHADQQARPSDGMPQRLGPDRQLSYGGEGQRRQFDMGVAAPYMPGRDKIEKMGTRKGGKR
jgi:hypothetical protein